MEEREGKRKPRKEKRNQGKEKEELIWGAQTSGTDIIPETSSKGKLTIRSCICHFQRKKPPFQHNSGEWEEGSDGPGWLVLAGEQGWRKEDMPESRLSWRLPPTPTLHPPTWFGKPSGTGLLYLIFKIFRFGWDLRFRQRSWGRQSGGQPSLGRRPAGLTGEGLAEGRRLPLAWSIVLKRTRQQSIRWKGSGSFPRGK